MQHSPVRVRAHPPFFKVHTAEHIVERLELPSDLIRDVSGQVAFEEEAPRCGSRNTFASRPTPWQNKLERLSAESFFAGMWPVL